jgi:hypothetical protein
MTTETLATMDRLSSLDQAMESGGIAADPVNLLLLAHTARDLGASEVLVSVMVDEDEAEVARIRAYSRVSVHVANHLPSTPVARPERHLLPAC